MKIAKIINGNNKIYFTFKDKEYTVIYYKDNKHLACDCYNGSNMGVNNVQICKHKKFIIENYLKELKPTLLLSEVK